MQDDGETTGAEKNTTREIIEVDQILAEAAKKTPMSAVKESATDLSSNSDEDEVSEVFINYTIYNFFYFHKL